MYELEHLEEALGFAGWLLANEAHADASGRVTNPLAMVASDEREGCFWIEFKDDHKDYYQLAGIGKKQIAELGKGYRAWAYAYDMDFGPAGKVILLELGCRGLGVSLAVGQRYASGVSELEFALVGDLQILMRELLPRPILQALEDSGWRDLIAEGAMSHPSGEERWDIWDSSRAPEQRPCQVGDFRFVSPLGWIGQPGSAEGRWIFFRPFPSGETGNSTLYITVLVWQEHYSLEGVVEKMQRTELELGNPVLESRVLAFPRLGLNMGRLLWEDIEKSLHRQAALFPTGKPGRFLFLQTESSPESFEEAQRALDEVLASLDRTNGISSEAHEPGRD